MKNLLFHIDHSSHPEYITEILQLLESGVKYDDIFDYGKNEGKFSSINTKKSFNNVLTNLKRLEIINKDNAWPKFGEILLKHLHDNDILSNLLHYKLFSLWNPGNYANNCFSWSYQTICKILADYDGQLTGRS